MKLLVCGGRDYTDIEHFNKEMDKVENKLDSFKTEVKTYVIILAALMFFCSLQFLI